MRSLSDCGMVVHFRVGSMMIDRYGARYVQLRDVCADCQAMQEVVAVVQFAVHKINATPVKSGNETGSTIWSSLIDVFGAFMLADM